MSAGISRDEWLRAMKDADMSLENDEKAITINEFAAMFGLKITAARNRLDRLVVAGKAKRTQKRQTNAVGRVVTYTAYRLK